MAHSTDLDPRKDQRQDNTDRFLLRPHPTIHFSKSLLSSFLVINHHLSARGSGRPSSTATSIFPIGEHPGRLNPTSSSAHHTALRSCCPRKARHRSPELAAHVHAPCSYRFQHVVNVGSAVDDLRFALKAAAKATAPAATVLKSDFL
ncbi:hypothetical protein ACLOJK_038058 [Asimina triloba]